MPVSQETYDRTIYKEIREHAFTGDGESADYASAMCKAVAKSKRGDKRKTLLEAAKILDAFYVA